MVISCKNIKITAIFLIIALIMPFGTRAFADTQSTQYAYTGFSGIYQQICVGEKVVCRDGDNFLLSDMPASEPSAQFLPRDMGDGSYAFENRSTEKRIAAAGAGEELPATLYNIRKYLNPNPNSYAGLNDNTQHWVLEKAEGDNKYCLKSLNNDLYMGVSEDNKLIAVASDKKVIFTFVPLYDESPLYLLSINPGYERLSDLQRKRLERVYESVAGDVFEQSGDYAEGNNPKSTPRAKIDDIYRQVSEKGNDPDTCFSKLNSYIKLGNAFVTIQLQSNLYISRELPWTKGNYSKIISNGKDLPEQSNDDSQRYECTVEIYNINDELEQEIKMTITDNGRKVITNARMFADIFPRIPYVLRKNIKYVSCYKSSSGKFLSDLNTIQIALAAGCTEDSMLYSLVHELGHSIDRGYGKGYHFSSHGEWEEARNQDIFSVSNYADENNHESFAEFCRFYFSAYTNKDWARALEILCPNQYELFKRVRMEYLDGYTLWYDGEPGDVNGDGEITLADAVLTLRFATGADLGGAEFIESAADVSGDGSVTVDDAAAILRIAMNASI